MKMAIASVTITMTRSTTQTATTAATTAAVTVPLILSGTPPTENRRVCTLPLSRERVPVGRTP